jgi:signal transduction histidine kinase
MALLLVVAIISVVALASVVAFSVVGLPGPEGWANDVARQIVAATHLAESDPANAIHVLRGSPAGGPPDAGVTATLREALGRIGTPLDVIVTRPFPDAGVVVSAPVAGKGWLVLDVAVPGRPRGGWLIFVGWMMLIVAGAIGVSLFLTYVMTRPLVLIEDAVRRVGPDGAIPPLPETGPPEARAAASALNRLSARLKSAMDSRMRLIAAAGHDLRTPLTRMRLRVEFLDENERAEWSKDLDELDRIADSAIGLVREEVEGGAVESIDLGALTAEVANDLRSIGRSIEIGKIDSVPVRVAPLALKRALRNLLTNAATHGHGATVRVERDAASARVIVEDRGPGIPPELIDRVFEPFFRVDPARRQSVPGAGLGLAIVKEIITRQGGTVTIANREGGGLRQVVSLPA